MHPGSPVLNHLTNTSGACGHDRNAASLRLGGGVAECLLGRRVDIHVGCTVELGQLTRLAARQMMDTYVSTHNLDRSVPTHDDQLESLRVILVPLPQELERGAQRREVLERIRATFVRDEQQDLGVGVEVKHQPGAVARTGGEDSKSTPLGTTFARSIAGARIDRRARSISQCDGVVTASRQVLRMRLLTMPVQARDVARDGRRDREIGAGSTTGLPTGTTGRTGAVPGEQPRVAQSGHNRHLARESW